MTFDRARLPDPVNFYQAEGLVLIGRGKWRTAGCVFHDDKTPSLRINVESGGFICHGCGAHGGDVLAYAMQARGLGFVEACRELGAWVEDGKPGQVPIRPPGLSPLARLEALNRESLIAWVVAADMVHKRGISQADFERLTQAVARISAVSWKGKQ